MANTTIHKHCTLLVCSDTRWFSPIAFHYTLHISVAFIAQGCHLTSLAIK